MVGFMVSRSATAISRVVLAALAGASAAGSAWSQSQSDSLALKFEGAVSRDRFYVRAGGIGIHLRTKSGEAYDVTGPVLTQKELAKVFSLERKADGKWDRIELNPNVPGTGINPETDLAQKSYLTQSADGTATSTQKVLMLKARSAAGVPSLLNTMDTFQQLTIGTPPGLRSEVDHRLNTAALSVGYFLSSDLSWVAEAYLMAAPLRASAVMTGVIRGLDLNPNRIAESDPVLRPSLVSGQKIVESKILPPTVLFGRYWGDKGSRFRPYTGVMGIYAVFFDTKATPALNQYIGGSTPGDTTASIRNAFGVGPLAGFKYQADDDWHVSVNVGYARINTEATVTTRNTFYTRTTPVIKDLGVLADIINTGNDIFNPEKTPIGLNKVVEANGGLNGLISRAVGTVRNGQPNLGTYVRKQNLTLENTLFMVSVGRAF